MRGEQEGWGRGGVPAMGVLTLPIPPLAEIPGHRPEANPPTPHPREGTGRPGLSGGLGAWGGGRREHETRQRQTRGARGNENDPGPLDLGFMCPGV